MTLEDLGPFADGRVFGLVTIGLPLFVVGAVQVWRGRRRPELRASWEHRASERLLGPALLLLGFAAYLALPFEASNPKRLQELQFVEACEENCARQGTTRACKKFCACALDATQRDPRFRQVAREIEATRSQESVEKLRELVAHCLPDG